VREGLIRNIQKVSIAEDAYDNALAGAVMCGVGNFGVELDYADDDAMGDQNINIIDLPDHMAVLWDRNMVNKTGKDATRCFVVENMTQQDFYQQWPWAQPNNIMIDVNLRGDLRMTGWVSINDVRVVNYWRMRKRKRTIALTIDGATIDITDNNDPLTMLKIAQREDGSPVIREVERRFVQMYTCSGSDILEGPYELPIDRIPIFRVPGWEVRVGEWRHRFGLVRFLKDPQRLHNYWRSVVAERLMQTPRAVWKATQEAVAGREADWRNSHLTDDPLLIWNGSSGQPPERVPPAQMEDAILEQAENTNQDLKDVSNIHEANLGMPSNEVSSLAIQARQRVSDTGTVIYHANLASAIEECGRVINELIPVVYDTPRVIKVLGPDQKTQLQLAINQFNDPKSIDITVGKYSVTCGVGPSYATKRIEQNANIVGLAQSMPEILQTSADIIVEAMDWPDAEKIAARLRNALPPGLLSPDEMTPQQQANAQQASQQQALAQQQAQRMAVAQWLKAQSDAMLNTARARNFAAEADNQPLKAQDQAMRTAADLTHMEYQNRLDAIRIGQGK